MSVRKRQSSESANSINDSMLPLQNRTHELENGKFRGDGKNILLLFLLYTLQGIPLGLSAAIPMILQHRGVSYKQQAEFSFVTWPFSLKLLWAPLVDSLFVSSIGRRKTWLLPTQYLLSLTMLVLSNTVHLWLGSKEVEPNIAALTAGFFFLNFLAATQDIVVDGWALTMLKKCNVGYASTCNSTGQTTGYFMGYVLFMALESPEFCNSYLRAEPQAEGLITISGFLSFWSIVLFVTTTLVAVLKRENEDDEQVEMNFQEAYTSLWTILKMPPIQLFVLILLTVKIGFASPDAVTGLKLVEGGLPKEKLGLLAVPLIPLQVIMVLVISKWTTGPKPLNIFIKMIPYRLSFGFVAMLLVWLTPMVVTDGLVPFYYYLVILVCYAFHQVLVNCMFVGMMAFFTKISDPSVGGTYMTLLNTGSNLGGNWPSTLSLWVVDFLTWKGCESAEKVQNSCSTLVERKTCTEAGGTCLTYLDGFYIETLICIVFGYLWFIWGKRKLRYLQSLSDDHWKIENKNKPS